MKIIENITTDIPNGENEKLTYSTLISICVEQQEQGGFSIEEMKKRMRIIDILEKSEDKIELEDADFEKTKELVNKMKWAKLDKDIIAFVDLINNTK